MFIKDLDCCTFYQPLRSSCLFFERARKLSQNYSLKTNVKQVYFFQILIAGRKKPLYLGQCDILNLPEISFDGQVLET